MKVFHGALKESTMNESGPTNTVAMFQMQTLDKCWGRTVVESIKVFQPKETVFWLDFQGVATTSLPLCLQNWLSSLGHYCWFKPKVVPLVQYYTVQWSATPAKTRSYVIFRSVTT